MGHLYIHHHIKAPGDKRKSRQELGDMTKFTQRRRMETFLNLNADNTDDVILMHKIHDSFDKTHFQRLLVEWIVTESLPFRLVDSPGFRALCCYLNPQIETQQAILSRNSIRSRIVAQFHHHHQRVIDVLRRAPGQIHFAFDGWRSGSRHNVYGLTCFFRDALTDQPRKIVLGMPEVRGSHDGAVIGAAMVDLINQYKIGHKVGYFTLDNASNMDTAMDFIGNAYKFDGRRRRGRCFGHIINLAAKALLDPSASLSEGIREFDDTDTLTDAEYESWRQQGPVGKLRIIVLAIDHSDRINDLFRSVQEADSDGSKRPLRLIKDNQTRWLGTYYMIKRALQLRQYIEITRTKYNREWTSQHTSNVTGALRSHASQHIPTFLQPANQLTDSDWDALTRIASILSDFEDCLIRLEGDGQIRRRSGGFEGSYGNIYEYLSGFEFILQKLEQYKDDLDNHPEPAQYGIGVNAAWGKINDYYSKIHTTPIYYAAHVFHPLQHWKSLECLWETNADWVHDAKRIVRGVWDTEYNNTSDRSNPRPITPIVPQLNTSVNSFTSFLQEQRNRASRSHDDERDNEYARWYARSVEPGAGAVSDPIQYWHNQRERYPKLSRMALDFLTIQSMSAECERLFSSAGRLQDASRSRLDIKIVDMSMTLRSWYRAGIINDVDPIFLCVTAEQDRQDATDFTMDEARRRATSWLQSGDMDQHYVYEA